MTIPMGGPAAFLVVAMLALTSCGGDDGAGSGTITSAPASSATQATQTVTATATATTAKTQTSRTTTPTTTTTSETTPTTTATTPSQSADAGGCGPVEIGVRDGEIELTYARITSQRNVSCQTVTIVAQQWGRERLGIDKALLPKGWDCRGNTCSGPKGGFSFVLYKP